MHLGIFAKTFPRPTLEETLDAIANRGLTHLQFNMSCVGLPTLPERIEEEYCRSIARALRERGLTMAAISGTFNLCDPDAERLRDNLHRLDVLAAACRWLDTRIITLCTGTLDPDDMWRWHPGNVRRSTWESLIASVWQAVQIADRQEVALAFEPEINNVVNSVCKARRLLDEIDSPWLNVVIDPANLIRPGELPRIGEILEEAFDWLGPEIVLAHAKELRSDEPVDKTALNEFTRMLQGEYGRSWLRSLIPERRFSEVIGAEGVGLQQVYRFHSLFYPYLEWLKKVGYAGILVMHGFEEAEVSQKVSGLQELMSMHSSEG
jgi:sugar phosphate isomerase/epimerase